MHPTTDNELVNKYLQMVAADDYEHFDEVITDDCVFDLKFIGHAFRGRNDVMDFVRTAGGSRTHDNQSTITFTNLMISGDYACVEYEHEFIVKALRIRRKIDGYCLVFHMRDGRFDEIREYINPSSALMSLLVIYGLRLLPLLSRLRGYRRA
jgi:ketosteroid isomerase-like protein